MYSQPIYIWACVFLLLLGGEINLGWGLIEKGWNNMINKGENLIISTFGAGFSWGAMYLKWGSNNNE